MARNMLDAYSPEDPEEDKIQTIAQSFTGEDGVVVKSWSMTAFTSFGRMLNKCVDDPTSDSAYLSLIQILTSTSSANTGISSNELMFGKHAGLVASMYNVLQEMGSGNRRGTALPVSNTFEVHISFESLISLLRCAMPNSDAEEQSAQTVAVMVVLQ